MAIKLNILWWSSGILCIENSMNYTIRGHLKIYKKKELECIFIEVINSKGKNLIISCIY